MLHLLFLLLLHFAFILSHWSPVFSYDSNMTTDDGPLWHLNIQHSEIPSLAPNAKIPGKRHNAPAKIDLIPRSVLASAAPVLSKHTRNPQQKGVKQALTNCYHLIEVIHTPLPVRN